MPGSRVRVAVVLLLAAPPVAALACYSTDGLVGPPVEDAALTDTFEPPPDTLPPPRDAGPDKLDAEDGFIPQPFDASCGTPAFEDGFDDEATGLNLWSPDFTLGTGSRVTPGRTNGGGTAELSAPAGAAGYAQLGYRQELTDRTVIRFFFRLVEASTTVNIFEAINGPNFRIVIEPPTNDSGSPLRTISAFVPGNTTQRWVSIKVTDWHEMQVVLDKRKMDGGFQLVAQMTLDDMFVRSFATRFTSPEMPWFFLTARRVTANPTPSVVQFDDARFWACADQDH